MSLRAFTYLTYTSDRVMVVYSYLNTIVFYLTRFLLRLKREVLIRILVEN